MPAPSQEDYLGIGLSAMPVARPKLLLDTGDMSEQTIAGAAAMADAVTQFAASALRKTYLDGVEGDELDQRVQDRWNLPRFAATKAITTLTFDRLSSGGGAGSIPSGTRVATGINSEGGQQVFVTVGAVSYGALETGPKAISAQAVTAGEGGNVAVGTLTSIQDSLFDSSITVINSGRAAGGADEETDPEYRSRARAYPQTLAKGTLAALEFGARQVPGVRVATATEDDSGLVTVYIADASGGSNMDLVNLVVTEEENWRAAGSLIAVTGGVLEAVDVVVYLKVIEGQASDYTEQVQAAVTAEIKLLGAGQTLYVSRLEAACVAVDRSNILDANVVTPAANVAPTATFNLLRAGAITVLQG